MGNKGDLSSAAAMLGRKGGQATSVRKAKSSRENGKLGGRPPGSGKKKS
jgi:hypothetical protein